MDRTSSHSPWVTLPPARSEADTVEGSMAVDTERKPILLTVDDDPGVSRAVARDLRRKLILE